MAAYGSPRRRDPLSSVLGFVLLLAVLALPLWIMLWKVGRIAAAALARHVAGMP